MAERRMFTTKITDDGNFTSMPSSSQALYFHLNLASDDDGFCNSYEICMAKAKASSDDLKLLFTKGFVIPFDSGVIVIKHWWMHNQLRKDRYHETSFLEEKAKLFLKQNKSYTLDKNQAFKGLDTSGNQMATEYSIEKNSIEKNSIEKNSKDKDSIEDLDLGQSKVSLEEVRNFIWNNKLNNLKPFHYYNRINVENIENWQEFLIKENELCNN